MASTEVTLMQRLTAAVPEPERRVALTFADGFSGRVDFNPLIARGGVYAPLAEAAFFSQLRIGEGGRTLEWPDKLNFCADALRMQAEGTDLDA
ncbi:MAG: DUF2442 domain-containing protein [Gemmatimonadetes bacterium]|nr:DUF2442 domain-containing protein [Gemmatimonadota bacterium]MBA4158178.1 DUF2442 domain-containing protein [Gemmatimonadota bacterium]